MKIRVLGRAAKDLQSIRTFIEGDDLAAARNVIAKLVHSIELIGMKPDIGRPLKRENVREWTVPGLPYVIPYRVTAEEVIILRVYHTRRSRPRTWK